MFRWRIICTSYLFHGLLGGIVRIQVPSFDQPVCQIQHLREVIAGVSHFVDLSSQPLAVGQNALYIYVLLLHSNLYLRASVSSNRCQEDRRSGRDVESCVRRTCSRQGPSLLETPLSRDTMITRQSLLRYFIQGRCHNVAKAA